MLVGGQTAPALTLADVDASTVIQSSNGKVTLSNFHAEGIDLTFGGMLDISGFEIVPTEDGFDVYGDLGVPTLGEYVGAYVDIYFDASHTYADGLARTWVTGRRVSPIPEPGFEPGESGSFGATVGLRSAGSDIGSDGVGVGEGFPYDVTTTVFSEGLAAPDPVEVRLRAYANGPDFYYIEQGGAEVTGWGFAIVPEPSTGMLTLLGLVGLSARGRHRRGRP